MTNSEKMICFRPLAGLMFRNSQAISGNKHTVEQFPSPCRANV